MKHETKRQTKDRGYKAAFVELYEFIRTFTIHLACDFNCPDELADDGGCKACQDSHLERHLLEKYKDMKGGSGKV